MGLVFLDTAERGLTPDLTRTIEFNYMSTACSGVTSQIDCCAIYNNNSFNFTHPVPGSWRVVPTGTLQNDEVMWLVSKIALSVGFSTENYQQDGPKISFQVNTCNVLDKILFLLSSTVSLARLTCLLRNVTRDMEIRLAIPTHACHF